LFADSDPIVHALAATAVVAAERLGPMGISRQRPCACSAMSCTAQYQQRNRARPNGGAAKRLLFVTAAAVSWPVCSPSTFCSIETVHANPIALSSAAKGVGTAVTSVAPVSAACLSFHAQRYRRSLIRLQCQSKYPLRRRPKRSPTLRKLAENMSSC
jgi:hypothetical protein